MYVDTSILAKLFVRESDSEECAQRLEGSILACSEIAYTEVFSAFQRKERTGEISSAERRQSWSEFEHQVLEQDIHLIPTTSPIVRSAQRVMLEVHPHVPIRTFDAIHLATFLSAIAGPLYTGDRRMREAALLLEIPLVT